MLVGKAVCLENVQVASLHEHSFVAISQTTTSVLRRIHGGSLGSEDPSDPMRPQYLHPKGSVMRLAAMCCDDPQGSICNPHRI